MNLEKKQVLDTSFCPFFQTQREDLFHALFECRHVASVWQNLPSVLTTPSFGRLPFDVLSSYVLHCSDNLKELNASAWRLWQQQNRFIFELKTTPSTEAVNQALSLSADFKEAQGSSLHLSSTMLQWRPAERGSWKLNVDGAIFPDQHHASVGFILCDDQRKIATTVTHPKVFLLNPLEVELLVIFRGLQFYFPLGLSHPTIESDCLLEMRAFENGAETIATHRHLLDMHGK